VSTTVTSTASACSSSVAHLAVIGRCSTWPVGPRGHRSTPIRAKRPRPLLGSRASAGSEERRSDTPSSSFSSFAPQVPPWSRDPLITRDLGSVLRPRDTRDDRNVIVDVHVIPRAQLRAIRGDIRPRDRPRRPTWPIRVGNHRLTLEQVEVPRPRSERRASVREAKIPLHRPGHDAPPCHESARPAVERSPAPGRLWNGVPPVSA